MNPISSAVGIWLVLGLTAALLGAAPALGANLPRVESGGRVVVIDDFEQGNLDAWGGDAKVEIGLGPTPGSHVLVWHNTDVDTKLVYKLVGQIPDFAKYTRFSLDIRAFSPEGLEAPGVANNIDLILGGLPWQVSDLPPTWGLWDRRPVFGDTWRTISEPTSIPEWYNFNEPCDNTQRSLILRSSAMFGTAATVMIDNIRLIADPVLVRGREEGGVWGEGRRLPNGDYRYDYRIRLRNLTDQAQTVRGRADKSLLREFRGGLGRGAVTIPPRGDGSLTAYVDVPAARARELPDLYHEELLVTVQADGAEGTAQVIPLLATKPLGRIPHPCILHPAAWWEQERARFAALSPEARTKELAAAETLLAKDLPFPTMPTVRTPRAQNDGTNYERPSWSAADSAVFTANFAAIHKLGEAYQRTRDERYAQKVVAMLLDFAGKYPLYPMRATVGWELGNAKVALNNLHESWWIIDLAGAYDLVFDSPSLTPEAKATIRRELLLPAARYETTVTSGFSNQTSSRYAAGALFGLLAEDANLMQYAVYGHHGLALSAEVSISPDGFLTEIPINYHWANLKEMLNLPLVCRNAGLKIDVATERIRVACDSPYQRAMPNLNAPAFGSCGNGLGAPFGLGNYPRVADLFGDPLYSQLATTEGAQKVIDGLPSMAFEEGGLVVLREKGRTGPDRTYLAILSTNSRRAYDQTLHFVLYSDGAVLCPTPGTLYNFQSSQAKWVSPWPNTIVVDRQPQRRSLGKILAYDFAGEAQMALLDAGNIVEGVSMQRAVALAEGLVFIVDRVASAEEHTYERVQMVGQEIARPPAEKTDLELTEGEHIRFRGTRLEGDWGMAWRMEKGPGLELRMVGLPGTEVFWGYNQITGYAPQMQAPTVVARRRAKDTSYLTVMEPFRGREPKLQRAERVKVLVGSREATDAEALAVAAVTTAGRVIFVVNFDGTPKTCESQPITAKLTMLQGK